MSSGEVRGVKRQASDELDDEQRFAKRFNLLNLDQTGKLYIPVPTSSSTKPAVVTVKPTTRDDCMQIEDTKDRVYIHNLDDELADIEAEEPKLVFLPDIEKTLSRIPQHVLTGSRKDEEHGKQELVLYSVPASLTVPEAQDSVRKAIVEARQRARERAAREAEMAGISRYSHDIAEPETAHGFGEENYALEGGEDDPDAMDMS